MSSIRAVLKTSADGSVHLPIPSELLGNTRLRVVAWLEPDTETPKKQGAGAWARMARGIARPQVGESADDARLAALKERFQAP